MPRWKIWTAVAVIFLSGVLVGGAGAGFFFKERVHRIMSGDRGAVEKMAMRRIVRELDLTAEERARVEPVVSRAVGEMREIRNEAWPRVEAVLDRAVAEMRPLLPEDKARRLDEVAQRIKEHKARKRAWSRSGETAAGGAPDNGGAR